MELTNFIPSRGFSPSLAERLGAVYSLGWSPWLPLKFHTKARRREGAKKDRKREENTIYAAFAESSKRRLGFVSR